MFWLKNKIFFFLFCKSLIKVALAICLHNILWNKNFNMEEACMHPEGGTGDPDPLLENYKTIGLLRNSGPDPLENHKSY